MFLWISQQQQQKCLWNLSWSDDHRAHVICERIVRTFTQDNMLHACQLFKNINWGFIFHCVCRVQCYLKYHMWECRWLELIYIIALWEWSSVSVFSSVCIFWVSIVGHINLYAYIYIQIAQIICCTCVLCVIRAMNTKGFERNTDAIKHHTAYLHHSIWLL